MATMRKTLKKAKAAGIRGDTDIVHVNPREKALLKRAGGAGTKNPKTGLEQYYSDSANEHSRDTTGHDMADHDRPSSGGQSRSADSNRGGGVNNGRPGGAVSSPANATRSFPSGTTVGGMGTDPYGRGNVARNNLSHNNQVNVGKAYRDYVGADDSFLDRIGNALAGMVGAGEIDPTNPDANPSTGRAAPSVTGRSNWGWDPVQGLATVAGAATGLPLGAGYNLATRTFGHPIDINMGPDFFGGEGTYDNVGSLHGPDFGGLDLGGDASAPPARDHDGNGYDPGQGVGVGSLVSTLQPGPGGPVRPPAFDAGNGGGNPAHPKPTQTAAGRAYSAPQDWLHYGENGGEWQFFNPSQLANGGRVDRKDPRGRMGRNGDTVIAHISPFEAKMMDMWQGGKSINPLTGEREYFKFGKVLKGLVKAAGAIAGGYVGGPAGAAVGGALASKLTGSSWQSALGTGLISGIGGYAAQQTGIGDSLGISSLGSNADLLGRTAGDAAGGGGGGGGMGIGSLAKLLPIIGIGAAAAMGGPKTPKSTTTSQTSGGDPYTGPNWYDYKTDPRNRREGPDDYEHYGEDGGEYQYFDNVNPLPVAMKRGGTVKGPGNGQSDDIPAMLSNNEHVIDAQTVAAIGNGDSDAGHQKIEAMKAHVRKKAGMKKKPHKYSVGIGELARAAA